MKTTKRALVISILGLVLLSIPVNILFAQQKQEKESDFSLSGFVRTDILIDSRQTISSREGHFLIFPAAEKLDKNNNDINAKPNFNILSIQSRITGKIKGPDAFDAKTSGVLEGEFFGTSDGDINGFRLRHAYVELKWQSDNLLIGQTWNPLFVTEVFPQTVSFNTGVPFQPFARNPQIRFKHSFNDISLTAVVYTQRDFTSNGPNGYSTSYIRNSLFPNTHLQVQYKTDNFIVGSGVDYKMLTPRIETTKKIKTDEKVKSFAAMGYTKVNFAPFTFMAEGVYGQNMTDLMMLGGYAVKAIDSLNGKEEYTTLNCFSIWGDLSYTAGLQYGLFVGYSKNLGANDPIVGASYTRADNIDAIYRISPRVVLTVKQTKISVEGEYTSAAYGKVNNKGKVNETKDISNMRLLIAVSYFF